MTGFQGSQGCYRWCNLFDNMAENLYFLELVEMQTEGSLIVIASVAAAAAHWLASSTLYGI